MKYGLCPDCGAPMEVEYVNNGVCMVWHGVHCGWGQAYFADEDLFETWEAAEKAALATLPADLALAEIGREDV